MYGLRRFLGVCLAVLVLIPPVTAVSTTYENQSSLKPSLKWFRTFGGGYLDESMSVVIDDLGNIYVATKAFSYQKDAFYLLKYSPNGDLLWNKSCKVSNADYASPSSLVINNIGDIYLAGTSLNSTVNHRSVVLIKYDASGTYLWNRTWNNGSDYASAYGISMDSIGRIYITGAIKVPSKLTDIFLLKYDSDGNLIWNKSQGGLYLDESRGLVTLKTDNVCICGFKNDTSVDNTVILTQAYNSMGDIDWSKTYGSGGYFGYGINVSSLDDIFVVGSNPSGDTQLVKYNSTGDLKWERHWSSGLPCDFLGVASSYDGNFTYATGHETGGKLILLKYDKDGNFIWNTSWHSRTDNQGYSLGGSVAVNRSGEIYVVGKTVEPPGDPNSKAVILKFVEVAVPEFVTVILPTITLMAIFIVIRKRRKKDDSNRLCPSGRGS